MADHVQMLGFGHMPKAHGEGTREKILAAAGELIAEQGWDRVTTRAIAKRAGVNSALIHYYFGTRDALLRAAAEFVLISEMDESFGALLTVNDAGELADRIASWLRESGAHSTVTVVTLEAVRQATRNDEVRTWMIEIWKGYLGVLVEAAQAAGVDNPEGVGVLLGAVLDGLFLYRLADPDLDIEPALEAIRTLLQAATKETP